jgi:cell division protein FtsN
MVGLRIAAAVFGMVVAVGGSVHAQGLEGPVSLPPESFTGMTFNDANGCAYMRAGVSGSTVWVARVDQSREPICGLAPTFGPAAPAPVVAEAAPVPAPESAAVVTAMPDPAPAPVLAPAVREGAPIATVASLTTRPDLTPDPRPVAAAAPVLAPVLAPMPAPQPRQMTLAQACAGRTGIQPGLISSRTGQPVDCGGAVTTGAVTTGTVTTGAVPQMTVAQICAQTAASGVRYVNQATGLPIDCPTAAPVVLASATMTATTEPPRMTLATACAMSAQSGVRYINAATGQPIDCGTTSAQMAPATGFDTATVAQTVQGQEGTPVITLPFGIATSTPNSNPVGVIRGYTGPPPGYEPVWTDGRLNPNRGNPPPADVVRMSSRNVPAAAVQAVSGHRYVQIGTYGDPANADRAAATLRGLGLPVGFATVTRNGDALRVVAAGPFATQAELDAALRAARSAGYGDAFTRG